MKKVILILNFVVSITAVAQVAIGKDTVDGSGILDFASGTEKGIILPIVQTLPSSPTNGTLLMDSNDRKIKMYENNAWVELTDAGDISSVAVNPSAESGAGVEINGNTPYTTASGVLVLNSVNQSLILPKIASPELNVKSPHPGMICYDTVSKRMAVFQGTGWYFYGDCAVIPPSPSKVCSVPIGTSKSGIIYQDWLCHNLGADTSLDPHTPVVGLQGAYIQWGKRGPNVTGDSSVDWITAPNDGALGFAAAPTALNPNAGAIAGWSAIVAPDFSWRTAGGVKTANDPCPTGYRVPTKDDIAGLNAAMGIVITRTGPFVNGPTEYGSALHFGTATSPKLLTFPANGGRSSIDGTLARRGGFGFYWSSTESGTVSTSAHFQFGSSSEGLFDELRNVGMGIKCIAE